MRPLRSNSMRLSAGSFLGCLGLLACASGPGTTGETKDYGWRDDKQVWVRGPWEAITPAKDMDDVIDQLCPAVMKLPRVQLRRYGQEYCGAIYSLGDGTYYATHPSPLGRTVLVFDSPRRTCKPPRYVMDERGRSTVYADYHSHPYQRSDLSPEDKQAVNQLWSIRIQFDTDCTIIKLVPHVDDDSPGEVFRREGKTWKRIGIIKPEDKADGFVTPVDD